LDYLIFDCAPGWDVLSVNILMAVQEVLCPVALQGPAMEGLKTFFGYLVSVQQLNQSLRLKYILPTMFDRRTRQSHDHLQPAHRLFRKQICIPFTTMFACARRRCSGQSIFEYANNATGANDYRKLAERLIDDAIRRQDHPRLF
jgi:chromosome partitioning protein